MTAPAQPQMVVVLVLSPKPVTQVEEQTTRKQLNDTGLWLSYEHSHFGLAWSRVKHQLVVSRAISTMAVTKDGVLMASPDFVGALTVRQRSFVLCHELLHVAGEHFERGVAIGVHDAEGNVSDSGKREAWGLATDMAINFALVSDRVGEMPKGDHAGVMPPAEYTGPKDAESIYVWLMKKAKQMGGGATPQNVCKAAGLPNSEGSSGALRGCLPGAGDPSENDETGGGKDQKPGDTGLEALAATIPLGDTIRAALSSDIGTGSFVAELLSPRPPRCRWETVLESGFTTASLEATNRIYKTYSRSGRRESLLAGGIVPGRRGGMPSVALVIDVSGSMDREAVSQIIGESLSIARLVGAQVFLAVHTHVLVHSGWLRPGDTEHLRKATAFSGGTDAAPAYDACRAARPEGFDCLVHFTDTCLPSWPKVPAKRLVVGATGLATGSTLGCQPPLGAKVLRVEV